MESSQVVVLGGGPAGYSCALRCADLGLSVTLIEDDALGGTCLHRGCVPTRAMLHAASLADSAGKPAARWGIEVSFQGVDMNKLLATRDAVIDRNTRAIEKHLGSALVKVVRGKGRLLGPRRVAVGEDTIAAERAVVLATGSTPRALPGIEPDGEHILSSDQALALERVPASALVVGGGAVGAELTQVWSALGAEVTILELREHLVPFEDEDVGHELARALRRRGVAVHAPADLQEVETNDGRATARFVSRGKEHRLEVEVVLLAVGRDPATDAGFGDAGVRLEDGFVVPQDWSSLRTSVEDVFAVGDLLPPPSLARAHVAYAEGMLAADSIAGEVTQGIDYKGVPRITHGLTETACVGLSEAEARDSGADVIVRSMQLGAVAKGAMLGEPGMVKIVAEKQGSLLGVHMAGPGVSEIVGEAVALTNFEATPAEAALVHGHPTLSEALAELNLALAGRPLHQRG